MPSRKKTCFEIPYYDDKVFTDDFCFNKNRVMPHI